jgi:hypothetical protein
MPTIDQLAAATAASDTDELMASQSGIARKITRAQIVSGTQPQISVATGSLLGRISAGAGEPEQIGIGANLTLTAGTLSASASPFQISSLPSGNVPAVGDSVALGQSGGNVAVTYAQFMAGLPNVPNLSASQLVVTPTGATQQQKLSDYAASTLPKSGGALTGPLTLAADPSTALQAATKEYVDTRVLRAGDTLTGSLTLAGDPSAPLQAATKEYVDTRVLRAGDTLTGPLTLASDPTVPLQAATKEYVDTRVLRAGDTLTGPLILASDPSAPLQATTKEYVDTQTSTNLPKAGGTLTGALILASDPSASLQAASKHYVDSQVATALPLAGGVVSGAITLPGNPTSALQVTPKQYVDSAVAGALPLSGGTMTGLLTLAAAPTASLQAATKSYVDTKLVGSGGTTGGPLSLAQSFTGSSVPSMLVASRAQSSVGDSPLLSSALTVAMSGGAPYSNANLLLTTTVGSVLNSGGSAADGTSAEVYSLVSYLNSSALRPLNVSPVAAQHVSVQSAPTRSLPPGGVPTGRQMAELWALWLPTVDTTNLPSSITNSITANESDLQANNVDDANGRFGLQLIVNEAVPLASGGYPLEWAYGILTSTSPTGQFKWMANLQGNYSIAVIDTRNAFPNGTAKAAPTITTSLTSPSTTVHVTNVLPFTSAGVYGSPVSSSNTAQIKIGTGTYTQTGYSFDGPGLTSGTLTFSSAVPTANGASGMVVTNYSRTIWMATGQQIAFDYGGTINAFYDTSVSALHMTSQILADGGLLLDHNSGTVLFWSSTSSAAQLQGNLTVSGNLYTPNNLTAGGTTYLAGPVTVTSTSTFNNASTFQSLVTMNGGLTVASGALSARSGLTVTGGPINLPTYTVAALPSASVGAMAYVTNGRKVGEAAGSGTGVLAVAGSSGQWTSVMGGTAVAA